MYRRHPRCSQAFVVVLIYDNQRTKQLKIFLRDRSFILWHELKQLNNATDDTISSILLDVVQWLVKLNVTHSFPCFVIFYFFSISRHCKPIICFEIISLLPKQTWAKGIKRSTLNELEVSRQSYPSTVNFCICDHDLCTSSKNIKWNPEDCSDR